MSNAKKYIILCSLASIITPILSVLTLENIYLTILDIIVSLTFFISCKKYKLKKFSLSLPIIYLIFLTSMTVLTLIMENYVMVEYVHITYYCVLVLFAHIMLNIYSLLCIYKKRTI